MELKKYTAELLGTFALAFAVIMLVATGNAGIMPFIAGLVLAVIVYTLGHLSGAHVNPAVTIGAWSIGKIGLKDGVGMLVAQFIGAFLAFLIADTFIADAELGVLFSNITENAPHTLRIGIAEALGTFFFTFGIASVIYKRNDRNIGGLIIGASFLIGIIFAAVAGATGILNPAIALGLKSFTSVYILGPIVGSIAGMWAYKLFEEK